MKIAIAADHGGFELKQQLLQKCKQYNWLDLGTDSKDSVDYPDYAQKVVNAIRNGQADYGVLICGTGIGISIAANRCKGIRAALLYNDETARLAKEHNNANVLVFGGRTMPFAEVVMRLNTFFSATYEKGRHQNRLNKIETME